MGTAIAPIVAAVGSGIQLLEGKKAARKAEVQAQDEAAVQRQETELLLAEADQEESDRELVEAETRTRDVSKRRQRRNAASRTGRRGTILTGPGGVPETAGLGGAGQGQQGGKTLLGI